MAAGLAVTERHGIIACNIMYLFVYNNVKNGRAMSNALAHPAKAARRRHHRLPSWRRFMSRLVMEYCCYIAVSESCLQKLKACGRMFCELC